MSCWSTTTDSRIFGLMRQDIQASFCYVIMDTKCHVSMGKTTFYLYQMGEIFQDVANSCGAC